ncbi:MAG: IS110 family transposase [Nitrososphaerales archaeon]
MSTHIVAGLDVHKDNTYATLMSSDGSIVARRRIPNKELLIFLDEYADKIERVAMEASTSIVPIYRKLKHKGCDVLVSHPKETKMISKNMIKTDKVDSTILAELTRLNALPLSYMPDETVAELREKVRRRAFLVRTRTKFKAKIKACLLYNGVEEPAYGLFTAEGIKWLHSVRMDAVESYLPVIAALDKQIAKISLELTRMAPEDDDSKLLMTIPGIGYYTALLIKSEIGEIKRFFDGEHLCSYAGLVPSVNSSGTRKRYGNITKEGSRWLKWITVECVTTHLKYDTSITRAYHRIAQSKGKKIAKVAAARRLWMCCYSVLKNR